MRQPINVPSSILRAYVQGKVFDYFRTHGPKTIEIESINNYTESTLKITDMYIRGKDVLDSKVSDTQCVIATAAYTDFLNLMKGSK